MQRHLSSKFGFTIPRLALVVCLFSCAFFLAFYSFGGINSPSAQPPFPPVENKITNGGLTVLARVFTPGGWVKPGGAFPVVLTYEAGATPVTGVTISVTLNPASVFLQSTPAASSGNGTAGSPLIYTIPLVAANGTGQIAIEARARTLAEDPEVIWKDASADLTLVAGGQPAKAARTHGPKVTTLETARYGDRPFPVVMVQYQDVKHCTGPGTPFPECTGNHTAVEVDTAINSRTSGKSVWQLYQDESFGQLFVDGKISPPPNSADTLYSVTPAYPFHFSALAPNGACTGTTLAVGGDATALQATKRIEGGWYTLPGTENFYGADRTGHAAAGSVTGQGLLFGIDDACGPTAKSAYDAAAIADPEIDYNDYDTDKDGVVDFFNMIFAGDGGNGSVSATGLNNIWPHSSDLRFYFTDANGKTGYVSNDQFRNRLNQLVFWTDATRTVETTSPTAFPKYVIVGRYNVNPETAADAVSVIAHEYGHSLGLPDYYSTGSRGTMGSWDLNGTDYFQYHSIFSRQDLGWLVPRPLTSGTTTMKESKFDTGEIRWNRLDGTPYTLTGPGIHNGDVYRVGLPPRRLVDSVPSGTRAWYSGAGNDFGCANDGHGRNLDFFLPDLQQYGSATTVTLKIKHLYEIEWDFDYGFVLVSEDGGQTWVSLPSQNGYTTQNTFNPNQNGCEMTYNNGITGVSDGDTSNDTAQRTALPGTTPYAPIMFINDSYDLTAYKGKNIMLRFSYSTDPGLAKRGWFIDDIEIDADSTVVYKSDFETDDERSRIFTNGWNRISSADGSPADHAYYLELRDRISNDFDGKGQSERGGPTFEGGLSMIYTDEAHGYGNFGVDDPPAQTPVDSTPEPGNESPNLEDAAFTAAAGRSTFNGCLHIDNYTDPNGPNGQWKLPPYLNFTVTALSGMTGPAAAIPPSPATVTFTADVFPACNVTLAPPVLSLGTDYENPDTDGAFTLKWTRPAGAVGPDLLQVATSCGPTFTDDASQPLVGGDNANWDGTAQWVTQPNPSDGGNLAYYIPDGAAQDDSLVLINPIAIPAGFTSTLTFTTRQGLEAGFDFAFVEVSTNDGGTWKTMATYSGPGTLPNEIFVGTRSIDLSEFSGQSIKVRFRLESDSFNIGQPSGWHIDNIAITNSNWTNVVNTNATSFLDHKPVGSYCYRVRTTFLVGQTAQESDFSNTVSVTVAQSANPTPTPSPTATPTASPTGTPSATPTATPTATPGGTPAQLLNISTRLDVGTGDNVGIAGIIITGTDPKRVAFRALGPSLTVNGNPVAGRLSDPILELYDQNGQFITSNDDWKSSQQAEIQSSGFAPSDDKESVILRTVTPGNYTAIIRGKGSATGIAVVEVYDRDGGTSTKLGNISSRGFVQTSDKVLIGGFIAGHYTGATKVMLRGIGPSLVGKVANYLADPILELRDANANLIRSNDDWKNSTQRTEIEKSGLAPSHEAESALIETLAPGNYTGIVMGKFETGGIGLVEIYNIK